MRKNSRTHAIILPAMSAEPPALKTAENSPGKSTRWRPQHRCLRSDIPAGLAGWLLDPASLTKRLLEVCPDRFRVRLLVQRWERPRADEFHTLAMRNHGLALVRQVQLLCDERPLVYARTVIPAASMRGRLRRLASLGSRPLGAMLFADRGMRRGIVELARITQDQALFAEALRDTNLEPEPIWGRRSVFRIGGRPLLVSEIFLPGFPEQAEGRPLWKAWR
jgi:chorismate--pyruvate lyase